MKNANSFPEITALIPHRPPMIMVDRVIALQGLKTITSFLVKENGLFVTQGVLSETGMLENIAQTSFIFLNYYFAGKTPQMWEEGKETLGYISNIASAEIFSLPLVGDVLQSTTITELAFSSDFLKICTIEGEITVNDKTVLLAKMKMLLQIKDA